MKARIYKPAKNTMQSGRGKTDYWVLEYEPQSARRPEPLMGWTSAEDTLNQVIMKFESKEAAISFAESKEIDFTVSPEQIRKVTPRSYLDNFKWQPPEASDE